MATTHIKLTSDQLLAEYVSLDGFKGVLEQRLAIAPDTLALLIRDGKIALASPGAHLSIGGIWRTIKDAIGGRHALRLLIADMKPFQIGSGFNALTKDNVPVGGEITIDFQVNPEKPANILGFMKEHTAVNKADVLSRLSPHLGDRVVEGVIRRIDALDLRGNAALQDKVQADIMTEVERLAGDIGLMARSASVRWAFNEEEIAEIQKRAKQREQEMLDLDFQILNRQVEREGETTVLRLTTDLNVEKVKAASENELRRMILDNELAFEDARETGIRVAQMKQLQHELALNKAQRLERLEAEMETERHQIDVAKTRGERRGVDRQVEMDDRKQQVELEKIRGEQSKVTWEIAKDSERSNVELTRLRAEVLEINRRTEELDRKQALALQRLEELQKLEIAGKAHEHQLRAMRDLHEVELKGEKSRLEMDILDRDSQHRNRLDEARLGSDTDLAKMRLMKDMSPEQILAINAGLSADVANVLVEQAKAKSGDAAEKMALMREMVQQAREARISSEEQARTFFAQGMQGAVGIATGVGQAAAGGGAAAAPNPAAGTTECPGCHRVIPVTDRHCRYCGRQMRQ